MPVLGSMLPIDRLRSVTLTWGRSPPSSPRQTSCRGRGSMSGRCRATGRRPNCALTYSAGWIPAPAGSVGMLGIVYSPVGHDRGQEIARLYGDRIGIGCRVIALAEDGVRQVEDVAGDIDPLGRGVGCRGNRIGDEVHACRCDGIGFVAAAGGVGDDRLDLRTVEAVGRWSQLGPVSDGPCRCRRRPGSRRSGRSRYRRK